MMKEGKADVFLGRIVKAFGIKGEVKLIPSDDFWDNVLDSQELFIVQEEKGERTEDHASLENYRKHGEAYVLKLEGVKDRNMAEDLVGAEMFIPLDKIDVDMPEKALPFQITGCSVKTEDGAYVGLVTGLLFTPAHDIYEVTGDDGVSLIPAVPEFIVSIDLDLDEIIIRPIPGLLSD